MTQQSDIASRKNYFDCTGTGISPLSCGLRQGPFAEPLAHVHVQGLLRSRGGLEGGPTMLARSILQSYLDEVGAAVLAERFDLYSAHVQLPLSILTSSANLTVSTVEDLQDGFDDFVDMLQSHGVTDMIAMSAKT